jgi:hypothetical protein
VSPTSVAAGGSVTATRSSIASPSATDWIGLYSPGSADTAFLAWIYVSCSNTATHESALLASGSIASVSVPSLVPGTSYHWQARAVDNLGAASAWTSFGANAETAADFIVAAGSATLSVSPTSAAPGETVTATWSGIASPTPMDWIGLYASGSADTAFLAWTYLSCSKATTAVRPSGACPFVLPNPLTSGTYELRLYANNGFSRLATGGPFTVP